jgi:site-specific DNA recombinase
MRLTTKMGKDVKKVGIWIRVSTRMQVEESDSLEHHLIRAEDYCKHYGWKVVKIYRLEGMSGKDIMEYPQTLEMLSDIQEGIIDTLVFSSLSRLARNTRQLLAISDTFHR